MLNSINLSTLHSYDVCKVFENNAPYVTEHISPPTNNYTGPTYKPLRELNLTHTFMFAKVMVEPEILKEFLQVVLGFKIHHIEMPEYEKTILTKVESKNIRLDIYADDGLNRKYCVEMQGYVEYNIGKRSRYYQSTIDIDSLAKGQSYNDLSDTFIIFICMYDPFDLCMQKYIFEKRCINSPHELSIKDGVSTIILADCDGDPVINEFFRYAKNSTDEEAAHSNSKLIKLLNEKVQKVHFDPAMEVEYMKFEELQREQFRNGYNSGIESTTLNIIKNMLEDSIPDEKICRYANCTPEYLASVKVKLSN